MFKRLNVAASSATSGGGGPNGPWIQAWHTFLNDLIDCGWRVLGSGDTYTFENSGQTSGTSGTGPGGGYDIITSAAGGEHNGGGVYDTRVGGGLGNVYSYPYTGGFAGASWRRLATPTDAEHYREYLFQIQWVQNPQTSRNYLTVYLARDSTAFSALGTAHRLPLPSDPTLYVALCGRQNPFSTGTGSSATPNAQCWAPSENNGRAHWFIGDVAESYDFLLWTTRSSEKSIFRMFGQLRLFDTLAELSDDEDTDPYLYLCVGAGSNGDSCDVGRKYGSPDVFRVYNLNNYDPQPRLEDRLTTDQQTYYQGSIEGVFLSHGLWASGTQPAAGTYCGSLWFTTSTGSGATTSAVGAIGKSIVDGRSLVIMNPPCGRATDEAVGGPEFFKGYVKGEILALATRFDDPTVMEDEQGANGSSTGRRLSAGYLHLLWEDDTEYME